MLNRKCPKCGGQFFREYDLDFGYEYKCLQCGFTLSSPIPAPILREIIPAARLDITVAKYVLSCKRQRCGQMGGKATVARYGNKYMKEISDRGRRQKAVNRGGILT